MNKKIIFKKKLRENSKKWIRRQLTDEFYLKAKKKGFRSRSAYKLTEINEKFKIFNNSKNILDLGSAPGSWCQVSMMKNQNKNLKVLGVDLLKIQAVEGVTFYKGDIRETQTVDFIKGFFLEKVDIILSDMAPNTTGHKQTDHIRILTLVEIAISICEEILKSDGFFVCKIFQGGAQGNLYKKMQEIFYNIKYFKPKATRNESAETYLVAKKK